MRVISVANQKGGCGKTTTAINLSACLAQTKRKILLIDMDPQGHSGMGLNIDINEHDPNIFDLLCAKKKQIDVFEKSIQKASDKLHILPCNIQLSSFEQQFAGAKNREGKLSEIVSKFEDSYDYVIIDCPPSLGLLTFNALMASTEVIIPIEMGFYSLHGTGRLLDIIDLVRKKTNHQISVRFLATLVDRRTRIAREILENLKNNFKDSVFNSVINSNVKLKEAASFGKSILDYDKNSIGAHDYLSFAKEVRADEKKFGIQIQSGKKVLQTKNIGVETQFFYYAPHADSIKIVGNFNNWKPTEQFIMEKNEDGNWSKSLMLEPGKYQYKFVVDENWVQDLSNPKSEESPYGGRNSILEIP